MGAISISNVMKMLSAGFVGALCIRIWYPISQVLNNLNWSSNMLKYSVNIAGLIFCFVVMYVIPYHMFTKHNNNNNGGSENA